MCFCFFCVSNRTVRMRGGRRGARARGGPGRGDVFGAVEPPAVGGAAGGGVGARGASRGGRRGGRSAGSRPVRPSAIEE